MKDLFFPGGYLANLCFMLSAIVNWMMNYSREEDNGINDLRFKVEWFSGKSKLRSSLFYVKTIHNMYKENSKK